MQSAPGTALAGGGGVALAAGIHRRDQDEVGGKSNGALGAADGDNVIFERLTQHLQHVLAELGQLIEEENAAMRQADLAGTWPASATDKARVAGGMVWRAAR